MPAGEDSGDHSTLASRLLWFAVLWLGGLIAVGAVALLIRTVLL